MQTVDPTQSTNNASASLNSFSENELIDGVNNCSSVSSSFEKALYNEGDIKALSDAMLLKSLAVQNNNAAAVKEFSKKLDSAKPSEEKASTQKNNSTNQTALSLTTDAINSVIDECLPCLERPEIIGGYTKAIDLTHVLFADLLSEFNRIKRAITLVRPKTKYSLLCDVVNALSTMCIPDLTMLIKLMEYYLHQLAMDMMFKFDISVSKLTNFIFVPFLLALEGVLFGVFDAILKPIDCITRQWNAQITKIPGADNEWKLNSSNNPGLFEFTKIIQAARDNLRKHLESLENDFFAAMCQTGFQLDFLINILNIIETANQFIGVLEGLINIHSAKNICGVGRESLTTSLLGDLFSNAINDEVIVKGDNLIVIGDDDDFDDSEIDTISDVIAICHDLTLIHSDTEEPNLQSAMATIREILGDQNGFIGTIGTQDDSIVTTSDDDIKYKSNTKIYTNDISINIKDDNLKKIQEEAKLDNKQILAIINLNKCINNQEV